MKDKFLTAEELSVRWNKAYSTLANWRHQGIGPRFLKIGGTIYYAISDIQKAERTFLKKCV